MPQPAPLGNTGESRTIAYALPSSSKSTQTSEVMYSSPKSPFGRGSFASSGSGARARGVVGG